MNSNYPKIVDLLDTIKKAGFIRDDDKLTTAVFDYLTDELMCFSSVHIDGNCTIIQVVNNLKERFPWVLPISEDKNSTKTRYIYNSNEVIKRSDLLKEEGENKLWSFTPSNDPFIFNISFNKLT